MTTMKNQIFNYNTFAKYIKNKFISEITGQSISDKPTLDSPDDKAIIGMLKGIKEARNILNENQSKNKLLQSFTSISLKVKIKKNKDFSIKPRGFLFYSVLPSYKLYENLIKEYKAKGENLDIKPAVKKVKLEDIYGSIDIKNNLNDSYLSDEMNRRMDSFCEKINDAIAFDGKIKISPDDVLDNDSFERLIRSKATKTKPYWILELSKTTISQEDFDILSISFFNRTESDVKNNVYNSTVYNAGISIESESKNFLKFKLNQFKRGFKNDVEVYGIPENADYRFEIIDNNIVISTENVPVFESKRLKTNNSLNEFITFKSLIEDPIKNLEVILKNLKDYEVEKYAESEKLKYENNDFEYKKRISEEQEVLKSEVFRVEEGLRILKNNSNMKRSFKYLNETMSKDLSYKKSYSGWRLFQLVFILTQVSSIVGIQDKSSFNNASSNYEDFVDVIYFPTGGGKTEAFLGATVLAMFYDRLNQKNKGITSIIKYPLRLLSVQQLDRVIVLMYKANLVKQDNKIDGDNFSVGYFVGSSNTPNLIKEDEVYRFNNGQKDPNDYRVIDNCPSCSGNKVKCYFNNSKHSLEHKCEQCNYLLPIYIVDDEVFRFLPTIVVSTVDKLAKIGIDKEFKLLFGQGDNYCLEHGFSIKECKYCKKSNPIQLINPVPTFLIQDELHLVRESLGTYASHYLHFINYYTKNLVREQDKKSMKIIGSTATISNYKEHVFNLYGKNSLIFPAWLENSNLYTFIDYDDVDRFILGFAIHGRSVSDGLQLANRILREILYEAFTNLDKTLNELSIYDIKLTKEELKDIIMNYWITIIYTTSKKDSVDLDTPFEIANTYLQSKGIPLYNLARINGDSNFNEIKEVLFKIQAEKNKFISTNLITATSSISHGVDEDSFNQIFFYGIPSNSAEYIQTLSRVGRKYTGFVFDVFRLARERDFSYLKNFNIYHLYKDRLIEPVPINKWAKNAIFRTLPGILSAYIIQYLGSDYSSVMKLKKLISENAELKDKTKKDLIGSFGSFEEGKDAKYYQEVINNELESFFVELSMQTDSKLFLKDLIAKSFSHPFFPMTSLRDVDEQLLLEMVD